jgi:hypothetical protein
MKLTKKQKEILIKFCNEINKLTRDTYFKKQKVMEYASKQVLK